MKRVERRAAAEKNLPMFVPGWEDSTLGNMYAGHCISRDVKNVHTVRTGIEYMMVLADWYTDNSTDGTIGFFQIGGVDHQLRLLLGSGAEREDHVGKAGRRHTQVRDRERREHRRPAHVRADTRLVDPSLR
jgi:hypothetical protein